MNNVEMAIRAMDGQCVRLDLKARWPNGYQTNRMLIGVLHADDDFFNVEETVGEGVLVATLPYHQARFIRVDNDTGGSFRAVISAYDGRDDD